MQTRIAGLFLILAGLPLASAAMFVIVTPLDLRQQWMFGITVILASLIAGRWKSRRATVMIFVLSFLASTRYLYWRTTQTLEFESFVGGLLGIGLYLAEFYAWVILVLGFLQTGWPLRRPVVELSGSDRDLPTVDIYIPTYNESLSIVRNTVFAALAMDYPRDRFKVYLLDDGRRAEFKAFARMVGCEYITRADNLHAKAGNLNNALKQTRGDFICVFDADHIPTRAFLQLTMGWFQRQPRLAILQTPHHFYSPDPVQRNLAMIDDLPGEGDLFYGTVQSGNDLWNATFFCGSCAVIRREALLETQGFAGETVTEDAHTALKLQRKGWDTAYINVRLAAGLATERLALHIGQRARWARGMTQILRIDNPLFGPGLTLMQRLCYLNAMLHFQFSLPRIAFLTSPLAYLLFGYNIIHAPAVMIFAYAVPHLFNSLRSAIRVQGGERRMFWSEIYETILCFHLVKPTVIPLFNPRKGKFNVTDKGGLLERDHFDMNSVKPHVFTACLLALGLFIGIVKLLFPGGYDAETGTLLLNTAWTVFSLLILTAAIAVARESRQVRQDVRVERALPVTVYFADGHVADGRTVNISTGGLAIRLNKEFDTKAREITDVTLATGYDRVSLPVKTVAINGPDARVSFGELTPEQQRGMVDALMTRADAWQPNQEEAQAKPDNSLRSLWDVVRAGGSTIAKARPRRHAPKLRDSVASLLAIGLAGAMLVLLGAGRAEAQNIQGAFAGAGGGARSVTAAPPTQSATNGVRRIRATLKDFGVESPIRLATVRGEVGIPFGLRRDEVATEARLTLNFAYSPLLIPELSRMVVLVNGEVVRSMELTRDRANGVTVTMPIDPALIVPGDNRLNLRFLAHYTRDCEDPLHSSLWANVSNSRSYMDVTLQRLPTKPDLAQLPLPFFDRLSAARLILPFVFAGAPSEGELEAAGTVASWFGALASYRGATFKPLIGALPRGNAVVFALAGKSIAGIPLTISGPGLALLPNPRDPLGMLLVVTGTNSAELKRAAAALTTGSRAFGGQSVAVENVRIAPRPLYSAPRWLRTDRPVALGELTDPETLQGAGLPPGALTTNFRVAPDLFFWPSEGAKLHLRYRYPTAPWLDRGVSRLDLSLNGQYLKTYPLEGPTLWDRLLGKAESTTSHISNGQALLPTYALFGQNRLTFLYDLQLADKRACAGTIPTDVRVAIDPDSRIDATGAWHYARLPNLSYFANAGFPFTRRADLSDTAVILPSQAGLPGIEAFLALMGRFGDSTGVPTTGVTLMRAPEPRQLSDKDILAIGPIDLVAISPLFRQAPLRLDNGRLNVAANSLIDRLFGWLSSTPQDEIDGVNQFLVRGQSFAGFSGFRSPYDASHSVVAVLGTTPAELPDLVYALKNPKLNAQVRGDLSVRSPDGMASFNVMPGYWVGELPFWTRIGFWLSRHPLLMGLGAVLAALMISIPAYGFLKSQERRRLARTQD
ncbi:UDP-forming cellulose synthase catalytic subunit [Sphingomonas oleivorans]|uniref:UDP-forming cellulose synthase catalytic subunit n=1 Tax=Sphingomonas oleivorans TaxID=1735121 RepID=UPI001FB03785|nr:UDP-forming cellulose synthase catalytic subunit [Sphingomonas oleivorans]